MKKKEKQIIELANTILDYIYEVCPELYHKLNPRDLATYLLNKKTWEKYRDNGQPK